MKKEYGMPQIVLKESAKIVIIQSLWHADITDNMVNKCKEVLVGTGVQAADIKLVQVPGALEISLMAKALAKREKPAVIVCIGAIIKGETYHFEMVANAVNEGMNKVAYEFEIPVIQQVLAVNNLAQLKARSGDDLANKGIEAANAALMMIELLR
ncbi:6,7-dimethyl-8-ribityllumazine synthase [Candidatus Peregrinibacteria bacterium CG11_big_fil_rev_8_21_14_0_20_41_10]|nr:MAG: 6,7-dimethyl-8-ribityllumazine synthase [Candidatus Peregrinibacteria bacterium CG11_big_fil_rev_8_21_14_0_20_41_10]PJC38171.1 MAG: 6,7-dimethyl-8-ribityllumazine synthase [Candidatus Peregrinibacteria bacterium CG_4_9_14_0_2_um_filter_41_14]